jgi:predicted acetylornithine/succinylornithine family transaminase
MSAAGEAVKHMSLADLQALERGSVVPSYARLPVEFVRGEGSRLWDGEGVEYLDFLCGISVTSLGHCHPSIVEAVRDQVGRLMHTSNLFYTEPALRLAERLATSSLGGKVYFCNSGAEANEAAIKLARKAKPRGNIVVVHNAFHGRTYGALSATPQESKQAPFAPLVPGVRFATPGTLANSVGPETAAVFLEPIQGEGGVRPLATETLEEARELADEHGAMLVFDEVQTGVGRTGEFYAWQAHGVRPDALTLAKGLANGLPIGALLVSDAAPTGFVPGDHASTFGGNPVSCAAACAVVEAIDDELLAHVRAIGERLSAQLPETRGAGLLLAVELHRSAGPVALAALEHNLLVGTAGDTALRVTPPLTISEAEADLAVDLLRETLR